MFEIIFDIIGALLSPFIELLAVPVIVIAVIFFIIYAVSSAAADKEKAKAKAEQAERDRIQAEKNAKDAKFNDWYNQLMSYYKNIQGHILYGKEYRPRGQYKSIWNLEKNHPDDNRCEDTYRAASDNHINWLKGVMRDHIYSPGYTALSTCISVLYCLREAYHNEDKFNHAIQILEKLNKYASQTEMYLDFNQYGDCELECSSLNDTELDKRITILEKKLQIIENSLRSDLGEHFGNIDSHLVDFVDLSAELMWCIAVKKPFNQLALDKAAEQFDRYTASCFSSNGPYRYVQSPSENLGYVQICHVEHMLAIIYAKNQIGGQNTVNQEKDAIMTWIDNAISINLLDEVFSLPSALAWMGLFDLEREVLRYLVEKKVTLNDEMQDRLGFLESGGNSNIKIYSVGKEDALFYDASASDWNAEAFDLFFRKLEMSHKALNYSLAISKWTNTLPLASGQKIAPEQIEEEFIKLVADFDNEVVVKKQNAKALNLENLIYKDSFVFSFTSERNRCVSILFSSEKYGRNLNTTIITMFTPESGLSNEQLKKYALAIKDNIYVQSFKESILQVIDEIVKEKKTVYDGENIKKTGKKVIS